MKRFFSGVLWLVLMLGLSSLTYAAAWPNGMSVYGTSYLRYDWEKTGDADSDSHGDSSASYLEMWLQFPINDDWRATAKFMGQQTGSTVEEIDTTNTIFLYAQGPLITPLFAAKVTAGTFQLYSMVDGMVCDTTLSGVQFANAGQNLQTRISVGRLPVSTPAYASGSDEGAGYRGIQITYPIGSMNFQTAYHAFVDHNTFDLRIAEVCLFGKISDNFSIIAHYGKSNYTAAGTDSNQLWHAQLRFKQFNGNQPGSYDIYLDYLYLPTNVQFGTTWPWWRNAESYTLSCDYVIAPRIILQPQYSWRTFIDTTGTQVAGEKQKAFRLTIRFNF